MAVLAAVPERAEVLMDENFVFPYNPDGESGQTASGWDIDRAGGNAEGQYKTWFRLNDVSASEAVNMSKKLSRSVTDELTLETRLRLNVRADGFSAALTSGGAAPVRVVTQGGSLYCETDGDAAVLLRTYYANDEMGLKIKANVTAHTADIYINGNLCGQGISFSASVASIDGVRFSTGKDAVGMMYISSVQVHSGYAVWDKFVSSVPTAFPASEWTVAGGPASVQNVGGVTVPDLYSMTLGGGAEITKDFSIDALRIVFSFAFYMSSYADASLAKLSDGVVDVLEIVTRGDGIYLRASNGNLSNKVDFRNNLWYNIKMIIDLSESTLDLSVNGKQTAIAGEPLLNAAETVNRLVFSADGEAGNVWIDDIAVYPDEPLPADYVPLPVKAVSDRLVGIQSCSLWREGNHLGWDRINGYPERKPLLGYYDEGSPEAADWEIKWLAEHGISFEMYCWYRPSAAGGGSVAKPIKDPYMSQGLHNGYFNAKYSDMIDFMIMWENSASMAAGSADFRTNILPFWIEYYLKDPRYLRVGNKPVISFMNVDRLIVDFGSLQAVREETDYIRQTCVDLGFDGAVLMTAYSGSDALALTKIADAGIDCVYSYSWGQLSGDAEYQKMRMAAQRDAGANIVPTLSMGRNDAAWGGVSGSYAPPADFARLAAWAKNEFMTSLPPSSIGAEMVLLDNWNEFGEGHFMMPAETFGFGYLDAVRNVFTSGGAHTDTIPDANQKARLNRLYDAERRMTPRRKEEKPIQLYKKTAWNFNTDGDSEGWGPCANVSGLTASGGVFGGNSLNADPSVQSVDSLDIDITDSSYITVKMRNGTNSAAAQIYFQLMGDTVFTEGKSVQFIINGNDGNYTEYVVDMSANANWTGRLKRLRLDPCMAAGNFSVDFIGIQ
jgi:hypothetical protein